MAATSEYTAVMLGMGSVGQHLFEVSKNLPGLWLCKYKTTVCACAVVTGFGQCGYTGRPQQSHFSHCQTSDLYLMVCCYARGWLLSPCAPVAAANRPWPTTPCPHRWCLGFKRWRFMQRWLATGCHAGMETCGAQASGLYTLCVHACITLFLHSTASHSMRGCDSYTKCRAHHSRLARPGRLRVPVVASRLSYEVRTPFLHWLISV